MLPNSTNQEKNIASYIQHRFGKEAYPVAQTIRKGVLQTIDLPPHIPANNRGVDYLTIFRVEVVRAVAKRRITLNQDLKKGFATVYDQCSQEVRDKLESPDGWETILTDQSLHELILKIDRICVGFDDHKQEFHNLLQAIKTLFLYTQTEKESVEHYSRNLTSMWDTAIAFGASPGIHRGLVEGWLLAEPGRIANINNITNAERAEAETQTSEAVKAALIISGAEKRRYGGLNNDLGKNYLLGTDQYLDITEKSRVLLGNYKPPRQQQRYQPRDDGGVAFIQRGRGDSGGRRRNDRGGCSGGTGRGNVTTVSTISEEKSVARSNRNGETHCFHCGEEGHWANMCPLLLEEQQSQLQMNIIVEDEASDEENELKKRERQLHGNPSGHATRKGTS